MKGFSISWKSILLSFLLLYFGGTLTDAKPTVEEILAEVQKFVEQYGEDFTYDQLQQFLENQLGEGILFEDYPRLFPFCVTHKLIEDEQRTTDKDHIKKFEHVIEQMEVFSERFYAFKKEKHSIHGNTTWIEKMTLSRINTPELDMVNLRQWLHIRVETKDPVHGIYMQSVVGPLGLPFGEFNLDFPCKDDLANTENINKIGDLVECTYRPRSTIVHPSAYVGYDPSRRKTWDTHFLWTDLTCMETPYVQFLILVGKDLDVTPEETVRGKTYEAMLSPVYLNTVFDSLSGAPFPYYPDWRDRMYCFLDAAKLETTYMTEYPMTFPSKKLGIENETKYQPLSWTEHDKTFRIQPNEVYDKCLTAETHPDRDEDRFECPPGPFRCDRSAADLTPGQIEHNRTELIENENTLNGCEPCIIPSCIEAGFEREKCESSSKTIIEIHKISDVSEIAEKHSRSKGHGILAILGFLVFLPLANYMGRFFKELCGGCWCGNGPWIFLHILLHAASFSFIWLSLGPVTNEVWELNHCSKDFPKGKERNDCYKEQVVENTHVVLGAAAVLFYHCVVAFSFWRSVNIKIRHIQVTLHSHFGYFTWILAALCGEIGTGFKCWDFLLFNLFLFLSPLLFNVIAVVIDCMLDRRVGVVPPRKQWPTLEPIQIEGKAPYSKVKWLVFGIFCFVQFLLWMLVFVSANIANEQLENALISLAQNETDNVNIRSTNETNYVLIDGFFDNDCEIRLKNLKPKKEQNATIEYGEKTTPQPPGR